MPSVKVDPPNYARRNRLYHNGLRDGPRLLWKRLRSECFTGCTNVVENFAARQD